MYTHTLLLLPDFLLLPPIPRIGCLFPPGIILREVPVPSAGDEPPSCCWIPPVRLLGGAPVVRLIAPLPPR